MPIPKTSQDLIDRARSMLGKKTVYALGKGGRNPNNAKASDKNNKLDCSGFVAWCLGFDRYTKNTFYANANGDGVRGWFETTAAFQDAKVGGGFLTKIDQPVRGCIAVYGDRRLNGKTTEGHIGIITEVSASGKATKVIHCSSSNFKSKEDAVQENSSTSLIDNSNVIFAAYDQLDDHRRFFDVNISGLAFAEMLDSHRTPNTEKREKVGDLIPAFEFRKNEKLYYRTWKLEGENEFFFQTGATICADGAPDAYKAGNLGKDYLENAGKPPFKGAPTDKNLNSWKWWALVVDKDNNPVEQSASDPCPGFFVSTTAQEDQEFKQADPRRYTNANEIPYIVLPKKNNGGARLGDFSFIINIKTGLFCPAIYAEVGPREKIGELSIKAAQILELLSNPRKGGTSRKELLYIVFPGSGNRRPRTFQEINEQAVVLFESWGGMERVKGLPDLTM